MENNAKSFDIILEIPHSLTCFHITIEWTVDVIWSTLGHTVINIHFKNGNQRFLLDWRREAAIKGLSLWSIMRNAFSEMPRWRISQADKQHIIFVHEAGEDYKDLARVLGVKRGTACRSSNDMKTRAMLKSPEAGSEADRQTERWQSNAVQLALPSKPQMCITTLSSMLHGELTKSNMTIWRESDR